MRLDREAIKQRALKLAGDGIPAKIIATRLHVDSRLISKLLRAGGVQAPKFSAYYGSLSDYNNDGRVAPHLGLEDDNCRSGQ